MMQRLSSAAGKTSGEHHDCLGVSQEDSDESRSHQPSVLDYKGRAQ